MTNMTPRQMRELADEEVSITEKPHPEVLTIYDLRAALRTAADNQDQLEANLRASVAMHEQARALADSERTELDRIRAVIENAPHEMDTCERCTYDGYDASRPCTCWKANEL